MNHILFTVYDEKAEVFLPPFFVHTIGIATRAFSDAINAVNTDHQFSKHPQDYTLFKLGYFDDSTAEMVSDIKKSLGNGVEFVNQSPPNERSESPHGTTNPPIQPDKAR